ncbi:MAG: hypothetical protein ACM3KM_01895 [Acidobacteriaceae bacterium]
MSVPLTVTQLALSMVLDVMNRMDLGGVPSSLAPLNFEQVDERLCSLSFNVTIASSGEEHVYQAMANMTAGAEPKAIYLWMRSGSQVVEAIFEEDALPEPPPRFIHQPPKRYM